ncbi:MAG: hypothetical protein HXY43_20320 [Fischerella sp.]|jgi:hypothetical protein|uniref:hypothetical protein n=1 Tax=Fischerella sp. TaxID=1191 RepID=UPI0017E6BBC0|nr:hypothetical protein [Fischerella sp.]NWF61528.1 hypothetical protein [Fischerella sp.]
MKNKIFAIAAASAAAVGSAIVAAPAQAQITGTPANVGVSVSVPEILYLRTVSNINVTLTPTDLGGSASLAALGSGFYGVDQSGIADEITSGLDTATPAFANATNAIRTINNVYAVWSNSPRAAGVDVDVEEGANPSNGLSTIAMTIDDALSDKSALTPQGLINPTIVGGVDFIFDLTSATTSGSYTGGTVTITASAP